ncbi:Smr/MutS family protein [Pelagibacteraceae bacterium]|nr:Smr/MutS family protein [Pelagibacteraceae bacterium]
MKKEDKISDLDKKEWEEYIKNPKDLFDKEISKKTSVKKNRFKFDLHGYSLLEANKKVVDVINHCLNNDYNEILLITGKGLHSNTDKDTFVSKNLSKLRYSIPDYLKNNLEISRKIESFSAASMEDGGDGAILVKLKKL